MERRDTEGWSIAGFTLGLLGLLGASAAPAAVYSATVDAVDRDEVIAGMIGTFVGLILLPILAIVFGEMGKSRVRKSSWLSGAGLAHAGEVFAALALLTIAGWAAIVIDEFRSIDEVDVSAAAASTVASAAEDVNGAETVLRFVDAPGGPPKSRASPWQLELADGDTCGFIGGATGVGPTGDRINYGCDSGKWVLGVDDTGDVWVADRWVEGEQDVEPVAVAEALIDPAFAQEWTRRRPR